ncbi:hypothetical protein IVB33_29075 [Bradyrhizobium sp. 24]|uniref:hypothetical protein n=1 Tax=unclassified Bradyrhizobium TaxID=2631580 RepID=UPI001FFA02D8|nr:MULTISPECIES: hypothetical protein [unclassified Bradyrhizobium]MCK1302940.1 hypothetical protein [Bradyrhizobium sp. 37]MCK1381005.1 hypothetical protein [Bradyrhizobium sp. 24]MCK1772436.1 hypothetical protein [Bradyrhizobium sp. 134]
MLDTIRSNYPGFIALRTLGDLDQYEAAIETFAGGGSRVQLMTSLMGLGIPADQIRILASYPGRKLPAMCAE